MYTIILYLQYDYFHSAFKDEQYNYSQSYTRTCRYGTYMRKCRYSTYMYVARACTLRMAIWMRRPFGWQIQIDALCTEIHIRLFKTQLCNHCFQNQSPYVIADPIHSDIQWGKPFLINIFYPRMSQSPFLVRIRLYSE